MYDENIQLDNEFTYQQYQGAIVPASNITNIGGSSPVVSINGVDGPVVNLDGGITGYSFTNGSNPITLTGAAASIKESSGPTVLDIGAVADGEFLKRVGTTVVSATVSSGITELTGDVTAGPGSGSQAATIANDAVTNAKLANMTAPVIKGRATAGAGDPEDLTPTQATALLNNLVGDVGAGGTKGLAPAPAAGDAAAGKFLNAGGSYSVPPGTGAGITQLTGDVTAGPGSGSQAAAIAALAVTDAKVATANKDGLAATPSMRTLGTGAQQATAGNDSRLSDSRAPSGSAGGDLTGTYPNPTLAAIVAAAGPIGDGTHVAQVTIDAKGRVTALSSVAITGAAPTGAAGGDLSGTYPNPSVANDAVSYAKMQNVSAASRLLGRGSAAGSGDVEEITLGTGITMVGTALQVSSAPVVGAAIGLIQAIAQVNYSM